MIPSARQISRANSAISPPIKGDTVPAGLSHCRRRCRPTPGCGRRSEASSCIGPSLARELDAPRIVAPAGGGDDGLHVALAAGDDIVADALRRVGPRIGTELRALIRRMSVENPLWGARRIHGELLKLGFEVPQSSVAKYMVKRRGPPSQEWRTFLRNHAPDIAAMDLFVVPTIGFDLLYAFVIMRLDRRELVWINVTANPTAEWVARQITEAFPWDGAPRYMIRDRDRIYGTVVTRRLRAMGIRDKPTAPASPWQNGFAERLIGSIRRESLDHVIVLGEAHMRRILKSYARYYNEVRTHRSLDKDVPVSRPSEL